MVEIIQKKRDGGKLTAREISRVVQGCAGGTIPDYQLSAWLMAVWFSGMDEEETALLSACMAKSGVQADLRGIAGIKADKHSTGGVGDKTTLITGPIAAACGLKVAKMSGRGLGHTGGTVDKLEAIPGFETALGSERFKKIVNDVGICLAGQSGDLAPADKRLYALRDVTATVDSPALIAASIMSKKLASGADVLVLDVKYGAGAFMKTPQDALELGRRMVGIGRRAGRKVSALVTAMDAPLGRAIGNALEVAEAVEALRGKNTGALTRLSLALAAEMLYLAGHAGREECLGMARRALNTGAALAKLRRVVTAQGGDGAYIDEPEKFAKAAHCLPVVAGRGGIITGMDAGALGRCAMLLGAGRAKMDDKIDHAAGIVLARGVGERVEEGETLAYLHTNRPQAAEPVREAFLRAVTLGGGGSPPAASLFYARVDDEGVSPLGEDGI